jgi:hypothetical protein
LFSVNLTHGKIDGKEGRGSFSGLSDVLLLLLTTLKKSPSLMMLISQLEDFLPLSSSVSMKKNQHNPSLSEVDLIVNGIWKPVANVLIERFNSMFSIGITMTFAKCFLSVQNFLSALSFTLLSNSRYHQTILSRLLSCDCTQTFMKKWKSDTYYQLRLKEVTVRCDKFCDYSLKTYFLTSSSTFTAEQENISHLFDSLYSSLFSTSHSANAGLSLENSALISVRDSYLKMKSSVYSSSSAYFSQRPLTFINSFFDSFLLELLILTDSHNVMISPVLSKCLLGAEKIINRLILHLLLLTGSDETIGTTAGGKLMKLTKMELDQIRTRMLTSFSSTASVSSVNMSSPAGKGAAVLKSSEKSTNFATSSSSPSLSSVIVQARTTDELLIIAYDFLVFIVWFQSSWKDYLVQNVSATLLNARGVSSKVDEETAASPSLLSEKSIEKLVSSIISRKVGEMMFLLQSIYRVIFRDNLVNECTSKSLSSNLIAIAGKYRTTSSLEPTSASPYIGIIFNPIK